jgi:small subunit ribosomal protein S16
MGRKKQPTFRIVVTESRNSRSGEVIEAVGFYCPYIKEQPLTLDLNKVDEWRKKGAIPTDAVLRLIRKLQKEAAAAPASSGKKVKDEKPPVETEPRTLPVETELRTLPVEPSVEPADTESAS